MLPLVCNLALGRCDLKDITELRQDKELTKLVFSRTKLPSERRLAEHLAAYKESDLSGLKKVNASLLEYLELLAEEPAGRISLDFDSSSDLGIEGPESLLISWRVASRPI